MTRRQGRTPITTRCTASCLRVLIDGSLRKTASRFIAAGDARWRLRIVRSAREESMAMNDRGARALITGASTGLGREFAFLAAADGWDPGVTAPALAHTD